MLFTDRRSSVIIESDCDNAGNDRIHEESHEISKEFIEEKEQVSRRLRNIAKNTFKRVLSVTSRNNSGEEAMELTTYNLGDKKHLLENNSLQKRRKSVQFGIEVEGKLKPQRRRLSYDIQHERLSHSKVQNSNQRRFSSYNVLKQIPDGNQKIVTNGLYVKNRRPSIPKNVLPPVNASISQNSSKVVNSHSTLTRKRRIKSAGYLGDNENAPIREDPHTLEGVVSQNSMKPKVQQIKKQLSQGNSSSSHVENVKINEQSPKSASTILKTLSAAKLCETAIVCNEQCSGSQNSKTNIQREHKLPNRQIKIPYRRRVAVSFSNYQSENPVTLSSFQANKEFDSSF